MLSIDSHSKNNPGEDLDQHLDMISLESSTHLRQILAMIPREIIQDFHVVSLQFHSEIGGATGLALPRLTFDIVRSFCGRFVFMERAIDAFSYF